MTPLPSSVNPDARFIATLLVALVALCLLALSLWAEPPVSSVSDLVRDGVLLKGMR